MRLLFTAVLALLATCCYGAEPPNIVLIVSDDQGYNDLGVLGDHIITPSLDRISEVRVRGNRRIETNAIRARITTQPGDSFSRARLAADAEVVLRALDARTGRVVWEVGEEIYGTLLTISPSPHCYCEFWVRSGDQRTA